MKEVSNIDRIKDLEDIKMVLDSFNVPFFVVYGALLGFYRDGKFLPEDDDIDLAIIEPLSYETRKKIGHMLLDIGFVGGKIDKEQPTKVLWNVFGRMEQLEEGYNGTEKSGIIVCYRNFNFTIFFFEEEDCKTHGKEYVCIPKMGANKAISIPKKFFERNDTIKIGRNKYDTPYPIKDYLSYSYYNNWKDKKDRRHSPLYPELHNETIRNT